MSRPFWTAIGMRSSGDELPSWAALCRDRDALEGGAEVSAVLPTWESRVHTETGTVRVHLGRWEVGVEYGDAGRPSGHRHVPHRVCADSVWRMDHERSRRSQGNPDAD